MNRRDAQKLWDQLMSDEPLKEEPKSPVPKKVGLWINNSSGPVYHIGTDAPQATIDAVVQSMKDSLRKSMGD